MTKRIKNTIVFVLSIVMLLVAFAVAVPFINSASAQTEQAFNANSFEMKASASVRTQDHHGIRFKTVVGNDVLAGWQAQGDFTLGTLIIPKQIIDESTANGDITALTVGATFTDKTTPTKTASPLNITMASANSWSKDEADQNANYKVFNAVTENLSDKIYNKELVARSYVIVNGGEPQYVTNAQTFSLAYISASEINAVLSDADNANDDYAEILDTYATDIGIEYAKTQVNANVNGAVAPEYNITGLSAAEAEKLANKVTPIGGFEAGAANFGEYSATGEYKPMAEGTSTLNATILGNKKTTNVLTVNAIDDKAVYANAYFTPEGNLEIAYLANEVSSVKVNSTALNASDYTFAGGVLSISKAAIAASISQVNNKLYINDTEFNLNIQVGGNITSFEAGELSMVGTAEVISGITVENKSLKATLPGGRGGYHKLTLSTDYVSALFALPFVQVVQLNVRTSFNVDIDEFGSSAGYTAGTARTVNITRKAYNNFMAAEPKKSFYLAINAESHADTEYLYIDSIGINGFWEPYTNIHIDGSLESVSLDGIVGGTVNTFSSNGSAISTSKYTFANSTLTVQKGAISDGAAVRIFTDKVNYYMKASVNIFPEFIKTDVDATEPYVYATAAGATVKNATLNGSTEGLTVTSSGISVDKSKLVAGSNLLKFNTETTVSGGVQQDYYYVNLYATTTAELAEVISFEDGKLSPFIAITGAGYEIVDSTAMDSHGKTYSAEKAFASTANSKVLKVTTTGSEFRMYISAEYIVARVNALGGYSYWKEKRDAGIQYILGMTIGDDGKSYITGGGYTKTPSGTALENEDALYNWCWKSDGTLRTYGLIETHNEYAKIVDEETKSIASVEYICFSVTTSKVLYFDDIARALCGVTGPNK